MASRLVLSRFWESQSCMLLCRSVHPLVRLTVSAMHPRYDTSLSKAGQQLKREYLLIIGMHRSYKEAVLVWYGYLE